MASSSSYYLKHFSLRRSFSILLVFFLYTSMISVFTVFGARAQAQPQERGSLGRRILATEKDQDQAKKNEKQHKPIKTTTNSTTKASTSIERKSQYSKATTNSTTTKTALLIKTQLKNLTSTSNSSKPTKPNSISTAKKSADLIKSSSPKNKTTSTKPSQLSEKKASDLRTSTHEKLDALKTQKKSQLVPSDKKAAANDEKIIKDKGKGQYPRLPFMASDEDDDFIAEFRDLPYKFHDAILPDIEKISITSKAYISKANKEITQGFKPLFGSKYASSIASFTSCIFLFLPLLLISLLFNQIRTYISLQKILIFIQVYMAVYFATLSLAYFATGLEPLKFFYATSTSSYMAMEVFQVLGYMMYLLMQLLNLVVVFSTKESGVGLKVLGLAQMIVGLAVGLHYYEAVFHRVVVGKPPKTNWKIHGIYAMFFLVICLFARVERRKKTYLQEDGCDDCKKS